MTGPTRTLRSAIEHRHSSSSLPTIFEQGTRTGSIARELATSRRNGMARVTSPEVIAGGHSHIGSTFGRATIRLENTGNMQFDLLQFRLFQIGIPPHCSVIVSLSAASKARNAKGFARPDSGAHSDARSHWQIAAMPARSATPGNSMQTSI